MAAYTVLSVYAQESATLSIKMKKYWKISKNSVSVATSNDNKWPLQGAHLRNQFKWKNTFTQSYDYVITLKPIISFLITFKVLICKTLCPLHQRTLCAKFGWNWSSGSWEEDENVKLKTTTMTTDNGQILITEILQQM